MSEQRVFTFGFGHAFPNGYAVIEADNHGCCREQMMKAFGLRWSMDYETEEAAGVAEYGLREVSVCQRCSGCLSAPWGDNVTGVVFCGCGDGRRGE